MLTRLYKLPVVADDGFPCLEHDEAVLDKYGRAVAEVFVGIAATLRRGDVRKGLRGPVAHSGFRALL